MKINGLSLSRIAGLLAAFYSLAAPRNVNFHQFLQLSANFRKIGSSRRRPNAEGFWPFDG
jgi:hypothetical protein